MICGGVANGTGGSGFVTFADGFFTMVTTGGGFVTIGAGTSFFTGTGGKTNGFGCCCGNVVGVAALGGVVTTGLLASMGSILAGNGCTSTR